MYRNINGYTPITDVAQETGRTQGTVDTIINRLGLKKVQVLAATGKTKRMREIAAISASDVPALLDLVARARRNKVKVHRNMPRGFKRPYVRKAAPINAPAVPEKTEKVEEAKPAASANENPVKFTDLLSIIDTSCRKLSIQHITWNDNGMVEFTRLFTDSVQLKR